MPAHDDLDHAFERHSQGRTAPDLQEALHRMHEYSGPLPLQIGVGISRPAPLPAVVSECIRLEHTGDVGIR
jgi:hypothetical protein